MRRCLVTLSRRHGAKPPDQSQAEIFTSERLNGILSRLRTRPLLGGDEGIHLSLAGAQDKLAVIVHGNSIALARDGRPTLIRCINRLEPHDEGSVIVNCIELDGPPTTTQDVRIEVGMVFQQFNLFPRLTIMENCTLGPRLARGATVEAAERLARRFLDRVQIGDQAHKYPSQLSGGQQQRVAIARALCMEPRIMLFDEPTSALDPEMIKEVLQVMEDLTNDGLTMICVTHEMGFARRVANRCIFMDKGEIVEAGPADSFFEAPRSERLKTLLSQVLH